MGVLSFIYRLLLFLFVFRLAAVVLRAFLGGFLQGKNPVPTPGVQGSDDPSGTAARGRIEELVRDPVCGVHTARSSAVLGRFEGREAYFCSEECAQKARN
jgi:YHS domain-containing protein